ncbi:MAG: hypothetical protein P8L45_02845 [Longimicrobiales bacterium]|nr:hypothetical protein [Longimicrobiales bacterium]
MENELQSVLQYLLGNPVFLVPILGVAAMVIYGILKKLIKLAAIAAIAGGLYLMIVRYLGMGSVF